MMKEYKRPVIEVLEETSEGVYAASGDNAGNEQNNEEQKARCRFGRTEANPGSDTCQACSFSGGLRGVELDGESLFRSDFSGCVDGLPIKES